jgi:uncharacterized protein (TIGR03118 family)
MRHMKSTNRPAKQIQKFLFGFFVSVLMLLIASSASTPAKGAGRHGPGPSVSEIPVLPPGSAYRQTNFVSDIPGLGFVLDPFLVNPWGISKSASSPFWIANNGTSTTQLLRGDSSGSPLVLNASPQTITIPSGLPTGTVFNPFTDFLFTPPGGVAAKAIFIFASETGDITAWQSASGNTAQIVASHPGHVYKGLAIGTNGGGNRLYAADFANGTIDVYDGTFALTTVSGGFVDPTIPTTTGNTYHPFNVQAIGSSIYVMYAKVGTDGDDEPGIGNGFVRRFNTDGVRDLTFEISNGPLNSPWGCVIAPSGPSGDFGLFSGALLIGNFGEGNPSINAFNSTTGASLGPLQNENGDGIEIDELWALQFGNGGNGGDLNTLYFTAGPAEEEHGLFGSIKKTEVSATSLIQFATDEFVISEGSGHIDVTVIRAGDVSGSATVNFNTFDESQPAHASQKSDYEISLSTITFDPGETSKTVRILIVNDSFVEGDETINLALSNPTGDGVGLGSPNTAEITVTDNDVIAPTANEIDDASFFVRQQYLDFLNREPDPSGFAFWVDQITSCGSDAACTDLRRTNVSAAFFLSGEFQNTGMVAYLTERAAFGNLNSGPPVPILYGVFERGTQALQKDYVVGQPGAAAQLEANKQAFYDTFIARPEFIFKYPATQTNDQYVDALLTTAGLPITGSFRDSLVTGLNMGDETRATVLRKVSEDASLRAAEFNKAFVLMEYFGYLRRDADSAGFAFWLNKLNAAGGNFINSDMVKSFLVSSEYRQRFGP